MNPSFNIPTETKPLYCDEHKLEGMINTRFKNCQSLKCKETPIFGLPDKRVQFCIKHKKPNMINLVLENKCSILDCNEEYTQNINTTKYCNKISNDFFLLHSK